MRCALTSRMRKALDALESECNFEDHRTGDAKTFILKGKLGLGVGAKTLSDLKNLGLIIEGTNRWHNEPGYRITEAGRQALK